MTIARLIAGRSSPIISIESNAAVRDAVALLAEKRIGALPVIQEGSIVGIFSERDVVYGLARQGAAMLDGPVGAAMTAPVITVDPATEVLSALALMTRRRIRHLPVVQGGAMVGFISIGDLVKHRIERIESEAQAMRSYIQST
ncbi:MAG: CBS domain-containing protein [Novosphingobium sp.]